MTKKKYLLNLYKYLAHFSEAKGAKVSQEKCAKGNAGDVHTEGCLKQTCKNGVWRPSLEETVCCYEREAFTLHTTITATTTQDGCTTSSIECRLDGNKAKMVFQVENNCPKHLMENQMDALEGKVDK